MATTNARYNPDILYSIQGPSVKRTPSQWFRKYFLDGQRMHNSPSEVNMAGVNGDGCEAVGNEWLDGFAFRHRKKLGLVIPVVIVQVSV